MFYVWFWISKYSLYSLGYLRLGFFQVHSTSKKLLYQLDHLVQVCHQTDPADMVSKCIIR